jgi:hypothetical protein
MKVYRKHKAQRGEMVMYEMLTAVSRKYNRSFSILHLPKAFKIDRKNSTISMPFYEGSTFNDVWNEATGGRLLGLKLSKDVPKLLEDLLKIDIGPILKNPKLIAIPRAQFNQGDYLPIFARLLNTFYDARLITKAQKIKAQSLLKQPFTSPLILNNGDFYPRNFIRMSDGKIVLIDWETWNEHSRANVVDHIENVAAYCYVHMWGNKAWQKNYVHELNKRLGMEYQDFQKALLIKSAEMARFWFKDRRKNKLCANQIKIFKQALNMQYMKRLWF